MRYIYFFWVLSSILFFACGDKSQQSGNNLSNDTLSTTPPLPFEVLHAQKFKIERKHGHIVATVMGAWQGGEQHYAYILVPRGRPIPPLETFKTNSTDIVQAIQTPIKSIVCTSTTHIPLLDFLDETATLAGFPGTDHIASPKARALIDSGHIVSMGTETSLNIEKLLEVNPEVLMDYAMHGENNYVKLAKNAGISVIYNADYLEETPLGRAEWIKFAGLLFDKSDMADSIFNTIATAYDSLRTLASTVDEKPTVFSGIMYGDTWFLPGGRNSGAIFLNDAGANYLWKHTQSNGSLKLNFETVFAKAFDADYWIGVADFRSFESLLNANRRYGEFKAFKNKQVYTYNAQIGAKGGFTFFELGYARPDIVLADLIKILHPELLPTYDMYFYKRLD